MLGRRRDGRREGASSSSLGSFLVFYGYAVYVVTLWLVFLGIPTIRKLYATLRKDLPSTWSAMEGLATAHPGLWSFAFWLLLLAGAALALVALLRVQGANVDEFSGRSRRGRQLAIVVTAALVVTAVLCASLHSVLAPALALPTPV